MLYHLAGENGSVDCGAKIPDEHNILPRELFELTDQEMQCKTCLKILLHGGRKKSQFRVHMINPETGYAACVVSEEAPTKRMAVVSSEEFKVKPIGEQCVRCRRRLELITMPKTLTYIGVRSSNKKRKHLPGESVMRGLCGKVTSYTVPEEEYDSTDHCMQCARCGAVREQQQEQQQEQQCKRDDREA